MPNWPFGGFGLLKNHLGLDAFITNVSLSAFLSGRLLLGTCCFLHTCIVDPHHQTPESALLLGAVSALVHSLLP